MKILLIHFSDIHFKCKDLYEYDYADKITNALNVDYSPNNIIIIVSGDIAYSGLSKEYDIAYNFFMRVRDNLRNKYKLINRNIFFVISPGNHDIDYSKGKLSLRNLQAILRNNSYDKNLDIEFNKMEEFSKFYKRLDPSYELGYAFKKTIKISNYVLDFNCINTALFSSIDMEQGYHYISDEGIKELRKYSQADYIFTIMHHPYHWYNDKVRNELRDVIFENSDVLFVGHEHYSSNFNIEKADSKIKILAAGELTLESKDRKREFFVEILDADSRKCIIDHYELCVGSSFFSRKVIECIRISKNRLNQFGISPLSTYMDELMRDNVLDNGIKISDYYVFPRLEKDGYEDSKESSFRSITSEKDFIDYLENHKKIIITGRIGTGKTVLLKILFNIYSKKIFTIYLPAKNISNSTKFDSKIKNVIRNIYGPNSDTVEMCYQNTLYNGAIFIDAIDELDESSACDLLKYCAKKFKYVVVTSRKEFELDIKSIIRQESELSDFSSLRLAPLTKNKKRQLIQNIIALNSNQMMNDVNSEVDKILNDLVENKFLGNVEPSFIVQYVKYCHEAIIKLSSDNNSSLFSKVYESNITRKINENLKSKLNVDKIFKLLSLIAFKMHKTCKYYIEQRDLMEVLTQYNSEYGSKIKFNDLSDILLNSGIMSLSATHYRFRDNSYFSYFVANQIKNIWDDGGKEELYNILENSWFKLNADIVLFYIYLSGDFKIIKVMMNKISDYTSTWSEFTKDNVKNTCFDCYISNNIGTVDEKEIERYNKNQEKKEKDFLDDEEFKCQDMYESRESLSDIDEMIRVLEILVLIARAFPSFEQELKIPDKRQCLKILYTVPLKTFNKWFQMVESIKEELIDTFLNRQEDVYLSKVEIDKERFLAEAKIREVSMGVMLSLMDVAMRYVTKVNTIEYIDNPEYVEYDKNILYSIQHLISVHRRDNPIMLINDVKKIMKMENILQYEKDLVKRVVACYLLTSTHVSPSDRNKLNSLYLGNSNNVKRGSMINQYINKK